MAIIDSEISVKRGKLGNTVVQGWKNLLVLKAYHNSFRVTRSQMQQHNRDRFRFLMNEYQVNKELIAQQYPLEPPYKFIWTQWISQQTPNTEYVNNQWQFIENPYNMALIPTPNGTDLELQPVNSNSNMRLSINNTAARSLAFNGGVLFAGVYLEDGTTIQAPHIYTALPITGLTVDFPYWYSNGSRHYYVQVWLVNTSDGSLADYWCAKFNTTNRVDPA